MILSNDISIIEGEDVNEEQGFNTVRLKVTIADAKKMKKLKFALDQILLQSGE